VRTNPNRRPLDKGNMNNTLTNIGTAYGRGYEMGKADAFLGFFTADDTVAEDFITDLVNEFHSVASLACYFLNGYTQGFDEMSEVVSNG